MQKEKRTLKRGKKEFYEDVVRQVEEDFENRRKNRLKLERQWELNMNFLAGDQYCDVNARGDVVGTEKEFFWQRREVFNHIAPIVESRLAKFAGISPVLGVRPKTEDDEDVSGAELCEKLLSSTIEKERVAETVGKATVWSETCGTAFYKITWDNDGGNRVGAVNGQDVYEGTVKITAVSPFEIFPDSLSAEEMEDLNSVIHAKAVRVSDVYRKYGVRIVGKPVGSLDLTPAGADRFGQTRADLEDAVVVIEKYEKPSAEFPNGRLITVADGKLLYYGELPYINGENGKRVFPFVKQECIRSAGAFFGTSVIERLIPVQRSFNAVKNRKQEFLNRLSMGIITVEDGSVDVDDLAEEGLSPGKIVVYRQGGKAPEIMQGFSLPADFNDEEERLTAEFVRISGVPDAGVISDGRSVASGKALEILMEQDNERMVVCAEIIRNCYREISKQILRLFMQFTVGGRAIKTETEQGGIKTYYLNKAGINSDEVYLINENELVYGKSARKEMILQAYENGLLCDDSGKIRSSTKEKVLSLLGYKDLDYAKGIYALQEQKAQTENEKMRKEDCAVEEIDDDGIHIDEHIRYVLCEYDELSEEQKARYFTHVKAHKEKLQADGKDENDLKKTEKTVKKTA